MHTDDEARLEAVLEASWREAVDELEEAGAAVAAVSRPAVPRPFAALYARAVALERREDGPEGAARRFVLEHYHGVLLSQRRVQVLGGAGPQATFLHAPLDLAQLPRLEAALTALFACVARVGDPTTILGAASPEALIALRTTLAALFDGAYYGGYAAPLYTSDADLRSFAVEHAAGVPVPTVIDRRLTGPFLHELTHFQRDRAALEPPYLDECVAALIGSRVWPGLVSPRDGHDDALVGAGWFTQVGEHLALAAGFEALVRAHAGRVAWEAVLPQPLVAVFARLGWEQYVATRHPAFLGEAQRPEPWLKALWLAVAGRLDPEMPLAELERIAWSEVPVPRVAADLRADFERRAAEALATRAYLTPEGAWRVARVSDGLARRSGAITSDVATRSWVATESAAGAPALRWCGGPLFEPRAPSA